MTQQGEDVTGPRGCRLWLATCPIITIPWIGGQSAAGALKEEHTGNPCPRQDVSQTVPFHRKPFGAMAVFFHNLIPSVLFRDWPRESPGKVPVFPWGW